eukprot:scaffold85989_cov64-Phaeocystis_antarctica.AAC.7
MKLAGLAFDKDGNISADPVLASCSVRRRHDVRWPRLRHIEIDKVILNASSDPDGQAQKLSNSNVPIGSRTSTFPPAARPLVYCLSCASASRSAANSASQSSFCFPD